MVLLFNQNPNVCHTQSFSATEALYNLDMLNLAGIDDFWCTNPYRHRNCVASLTRSQTTLYFLPDSGSRSRMALQWPCYHLDHHCENHSLTFHIWLKPEPLSEAYRAYYVVVECLSRQYLPLNICTQATTLHNLPRLALISLHIEILACLSLHALYVGHLVQLRWHRHQ